MAEGKGTPRGLELWLLVGILERLCFFHNFLFERLVDTDIVQRQTDHIREHFKTHYILFVHFPLVKLHAAHNDADRPILHANRRNNH